MASSTTKTGRHDIAEILLKVALKSSVPTRKMQNKQNVHDSTRLTFSRFRSKIVLYFRVPLHIVYIQCEISARLRPLNLEEGFR
jgi:hypothetical protein